MKKLILVLGLAGFAVSLFLSLGCYSSVAADKNVIELKFSTDMPFLQPDYPWAIWANEIEKRTNGRAKILFFLGSTLAKPKETMRALKRGMVDIGGLNIENDLAAFRLNSIMTLPAIGWPDEVVASKIHYEIIDKFPEVKAEFNGVKLLWQVIMVGHSIHSTKKPIRIPDDIKGVKIIGMGTNGKIVEALGATAVALEFTDIYMGLERNVAQGWYAGVSSLFFSRSMKLVPYHNNTILSYNCFHTMMSLRAWKRLPPDIRQVFIDLNPSIEKGARDFTTKMDNFGLGMAKKLKHTFITNTPKEKTLWYEKAKPLHKEWIDKNEARGLPAQAVFDEVQRLIKEYSK